MIFLKLIFYLEILIYLSSLSIKIPDSISTIFSYDNPFIYSGRLPLKCVGGNFIILNILKYLVIFVDENYSKE